VQDFLYQLFRDRVGIRLGLPGFLQEGLAKIISRRRAPSIIDKYQEIGGGSPLVPVTQALAKKLQNRLNGCRVKVGMRYTAPWIEDTVLSYARENVRDVFVLPLYPQDSLATTGTAVFALRQAAADLDFPLNPRILNAWYDDPGFLKLMGTQILNEILRVPDHLDPTLLFCAHSIPESYLQEGDPYKEQVEDYVSLLIRQIRWKSEAKICYQSKVGPAKWIGPSISEILNSYRGQDSRALIIVPISFVGDHIETLHEIDIEYAAVAKDLGIEWFSRVGCFNASDEFAQVLAEMIERNLNNSPQHHGGFIRRDFPPRM